MTLRRTASGLYSLYRFYRVDVVVICEGGPSKTKQDVLAGSGTDGTLDALYWRSAISSLDIDKSFHFKSAGNKEGLLAVAADINANGITTVTVCLDSDYDRLLGRDTQLNRVAYTKGYSWESDVLSKEAITGVIQNLFPGDHRLQALEPVWRTAFDEFSQEMIRWCEMDIALARKREASLLRRDRPQYCLDVQRCPPRLNSNALKQRLQALGYQRGPNRPIRLTRDELSKVCYGKLIAKFIYHLVRDIISRLSNMRVDYELFMRLAIAETRRLLQNGDLHDLRAHMEAQRPCF